VITTALVFFLPAVTSRLGFRCVHCIIWVGAKKRPVVDW